MSYVDEVGGMRCTQIKTLVVALDYIVVLVDADHAYIGEPLIKIFCKVIF